MKKDKYITEDQLVSSIKKRLKESNYMYSNMERHIKYGSKCLCRWKVSQLHSLFSTKSKKKWIHPALEGHCSVTIHQFWTNKGS